MNPTLVTLATGERYIPDETLPQLYRVLHDAELGPLWRTNVPEVFRMMPGHSIPLNREWQLFTKALNPLMTNWKWRRLFGYNTAFTNGSAGYDNPEATEPKPDWINGLDLDATDKLRFDQPRMCGGAILSGYEDDGWLYIDYIDATRPPPRLEEVKLWHRFVALNVVDKFRCSRFPQGDGAEVIIPLIARQPVRYPLMFLEKLEMSQPLPDPYRVYYPV